MEPTQYTGEQSFSPNHLQRAQLLLQQGRFNDAQEALMQVLAAEPEHDYAHAMMGITLLNLKQPKEALEFVRKAIGLAPEESYYHSVLALALLNTKKSKEALVAAQEGVHLNPDSAYAHEIEGQIFLAMSRWKEALPCIERGLALDPEDVELINMRSIALTKLGMRDEATAAIDTALRNDPDNARTHANKGWTLLHGGQYNEAMLCFREALRLEPNNEWARQGIIESIKAGTVIYRPILKTLLWMTTLPPNTLFMMVFFFFLLGRLLYRLKVALPEYAELFTMVSYVYLGIIFLSWTASTMFNLVLFAHPIGKHALSRIQKQSSAVVGLLLVLGVAAIAWIVSGTGGEAAQNMAWVCFGLVIPVSGLEGTVQAKWRISLIAFCACMALVGSGAVLFPPPFNGLCFFVFVVALVAYSWITSLGSFATRR